MHRIIAAGLALLPAPAFAHAFLSSAEPAVGSTTKPAPSRVTIHFTEGVEPSFSHIQVLDAAGAEVESGPAQSAGAEDQLEVSLKPLPPGTYKVTWHVVSVDTHKTQGSFSFTVAP